MQDKFRPFYSKKKYEQLTESDFFFLSVLQHFGAATPLIDVTRNLKKALFFAIEGVVKNTTRNDIGDYFSVYYFGADVLFPVMTDMKYDRLYQKERADLYILDDHKRKGLIFSNENIRAQNGAFLFLNPDYLSLDEALQAKRHAAGKAIPQVECFNIEKALVPYIRSMLEKEGITASSIYPLREKIANEIHQEVIKEMTSYNLPGRRRSGATMPS